MPIENIEQPIEWNPLPDDFCDAISMVKQCALKNSDSVNDRSFVLTCIHIHPKWVEATDNTQIIRYKIRTGLKEPVLARCDSIKHIAMLGMTEFSETEHWLHFRNAAKLVLSCRRFVEEYPKLGKYMDFEGSPLDLPKGLGEAAERASILSAENAEFQQAVVSLSPGKIKITGSGSAGWYREVKKSKYNGKVIKFSISPKLLTEIVKSHQTCTVSNTQLKAISGKFSYLVCLGIPEINSHTEEIPETDIPY